MDKKTIETKLVNLFKEYSLKEQRLLNELTKEEREEIGKPIKNVDLLDEFNANGKRYVIRTSLTINRFEQFEKLQVEAGYGTDFITIFNNIKKAYLCLNENRPMDGGVILHNIMSGIKDKLDERTHPILDICCLFICREGEDITEFSPELNKLKIADWAKEGIAMESFFTLAFGLVNGFIPLLNQVSVSISEAIKGKVVEAREELKTEKKTRK